VEFNMVMGVAVTHAPKRWGGAEVLRFTSISLQGHSAELMKFCSGDTVSYTYLDGMPEDDGADDEEVEADKRKLGTFIETQKIKLFLYGMTSALEYNMPAPGKVSFDVGFITMGEPGGVPSIPTEAITAGVSAVRYDSIEEGEGAVVVATANVNLITYTPTIHLSNAVIIMTMDESSVFPVVDDQLVMSIEMRGLLDLGTSFLGTNLIPLPSIVTTVVSKLRAEKTAYDGFAVTETHPIVAHGSTGTMTVGDSTGGAMRFEMNIDDLAIPCTEETINISGVVHLELLIISVNAEVDDAVFVCGPLVPSDEKPRLSAVSYGLRIEFFTEKYRAVFARIAALANSMTEEQSVDMHMAVYFGENGWYYDMLFVFNFEHEAHASQFSMTASAELTTKYGMPVETRLAIEMNYLADAIEAHAYGSFNLGETCEPGMFAFRIGGSILLKPSRFKFDAVQKFAPLKWFPDGDFSIAGSITRWCADYEQNSQTDVYGEILNVVIIKDMMVLDHAILDIKVVTRFGLGVQSAYGFIEGKATLSISGDEAMKRFSEKTTMPVAVVRSLDTSLTIRISMKYKKADPQPYKFYLYILATIELDSAYLAPQNGFYAESSVRGNVTINYPCTPSQYASIEGDIDLLMKSNTTGKIYFDSGAPMYGRVDYFCKNDEFKDEREFAVHISAEYFSLNDNTVKVEDFHLVAIAYRVDDGSEAMIDAENLTLPNVTDDNTRFLENYNRAQEASKKLANALNRPWKGLISGKISTGDGTIGLSASYIFDWKLGTFDLVTSFHYNSDLVNFTLSLGASSNCTEMGEFISGTVSLKDFNEGISETSAPGRGNVTGTQWCGEWATTLQRYKFELTMEDFSIPIGPDPTGEPQAIEIRGGVILLIGRVPRGQPWNDNEENVPLDWELNIAGRAYLIGGPGATLMDSLGNVEVEVNATWSKEAGLKILGLKIEADINYVIPSPGEDEDGVLVSATGHLDIYYPCPADGLMLSGEIYIDVGISWLTITGFQNGTGENFATISYNCTSRVLKVEAYFPKVLISGASGLDLSFSNVDILLEAKLGDAKQTMSDDYSYIQGGNISSNSSSVVALGGAPGKYVAGKISGIVNLQNTNYDMSNPNFGGQEDVEHPGFKLFLVVVFDTRDWTELEINAKLSFNYVSDEGKESYFFLQGQYVDPSNCIDSQVYRGMADYSGFGLSSNSDNLRSDITATVNCPDENNGTLYSINGKIDSWSFLRETFTGEDLEFTSNIYVDSEGEIDFELDIAGVAGFNIPRIFPAGGFFNVNPRCNFTAMLSQKGKQEIQWTYIRATIGLGMTLGSRDDPIVDLQAEVDYVHPCTRGNSLNARGSVNVRIGDGKVIEGMAAEVRMYCEHGYGDKSIKVTGQIDNLELGSLVIQGVDVRVEVYDFDPILQETANQSNSSFIVMPRIVESPNDGSEWAITGFLAGYVGVSRVGGMSVAAMLNTFDWSWSVALNIILDNEYVKANISAAFASDCRPTGDFVTGTLDFSLGQLLSSSGGFFSGTRYCEQNVDLRYDILVEVDHVHIMDLMSVSNVSLRVKGKPREGQVATQSEVQDDGAKIWEDGELDWDISSTMVLDADISTPAFLPAFFRAGVDVNDLEVDMIATVRSNQFDVSYLRMAGSIVASFGGSTTAPVLKLGGFFSFNYPCDEGDLVEIRDAIAYINMGPLLLNASASATYVCGAKPDQWALDLTIDIDIVQIGSNFKIVDATLKGRSRLPPAGFIAAMEAKEYRLASKYAKGWQFEGTVSGKAMLGDQSVSVALMIDTITGTMSLGVLVDITFPGLQATLGFDIMMGQGGALLCNTTKPSNVFGDVNIAAVPGGNAIIGKVNGTQYCGVTNVGDTYAELSLHRGKHQAGPFTFNSVTVQMTAVLTKEGPNLPVARKGQEGYGDLVYFHAVPQADMAWHGIFNAELSANLAAPGIPAMLNFVHLSIDSTFKAAAVPPSFTVNTALIDGVADLTLGSAEAGWMFYLSASVRYPYPCKEIVPVTGSASFILGEFFSMPDISYDAKFYCEGMPSNERRGRIVDIDAWTNEPVTMDIAGFQGVLSDAMVSVNVISASYSVDDTYDVFTPYNTSDYNTSDSDSTDVLNHQMSNNLDANSDSSLPEAYHVFGTFAGTVEVSQDMASGSLNVGAHAFLKGNFTVNYGKEPVVHVDPISPTLTLKVNTSIVQLALVGKLFAECNASGVEGTLEGTVTITAKLLGTFTATASGVKHCSVEDNESTEMALQLLGNTAVQNLGLTNETTDATNATGVVAEEDAVTVETKAAKTESRFDIFERMDIAYTLKVWGATWEIPIMFTDAKLLLRDVEITLMGYTDPKAPSHMRNALLWWRCNVTAGVTLPETAMPYALRSFAADVDTSFDAMFATTNPKFMLRDDVSDGTKTDARNMVVGTFALERMKVTASVNVVVDFRVVDAFVNDNNDPSFTIETFAKIDFVVPCDPAYPATGNGTFRIFKPHVLDTGNLSVELLYRCNVPEDSELPDWTATVASADADLPIVTPFVDIYGAHVYVEHYPKDDRYVIDVTRQQDPPWLTQQGLDGMDNGLHTSVAFKWDSGAPSTFDADVYLAYKSEGINITAWGSVNVGGELACAMGSYKVNGAASIRVGDTVPPTILRADDVWIIQECFENGTASFSINATGLSARVPHLGITLHDGMFTASTTIRDDGKFSGHWQGWFRANGTLILGESTSQNMPELAAQPHPAALSASLGTAAYNRSLTLDASVMASFAIVKDSKKAVKGYEINTTIKYYQETDEGAYFSFVGDVRFKAPCVKGMKAEAAGAFSMAIGSHGFTTFVYATWYCGINDPSWLSLKDNEAVTNDTSAITTANASNFAERISEPPQLLFTITSNGHGVLDIGAEVTLERYEIVVHGKRDMRGTFVVGSISGTLSATGNSGTSALDVSFAFDMRKMQFETAMNMEFFISDWLNASLVGTAAANLTSRSDGGTGSDSTCDNVVVHATGTLILSIPLVQQGSHLQLEIVADYWKCGVRRVLKIAQAPPITVLSVTTQGSNDDATYGMNIKDVSFMIIANRPVGSDYDLPISLEDMADELVWDVQFAGTVVLGKRGNEWGVELTGILDASFSPKPIPDGKDVTIVDVMESWNTALVANVSAVLEIGPVDNPYMTAILTAGIHFPLTKGDLIPITANMSLSVGGNDGLTIWASAEGYLVAFAEHEEIFLMISARIELATVGTIKLASVTIEADLYKDANSKKPLKSLGVITGYVILNLDSGALATSTSTIVFEVSEAVSSYHLTQEFTLEIGVMVATLTLQSSLTHCEASGAALAGTIDVDFENGVELSGKSRGVLHCGRNPELPLHQLTLEDVLAPNQTVDNINSFPTVTYCPSSRWPFVSKVLADLAIEGQVPQLFKPWLAIDWSTVERSVENHPEQCFRPRLVLTSNVTLAYEQFESTASLTAYAFGQPLHSIGEAKPWAKKLIWRGEAITSGYIGVTVGGYDLEAKLAIAFMYRGGEFIRSPLVARAVLNLAGGGVTFRGELSMMFPCPRGSVAKAVGNVNFAGVGSGIFSSLSIPAAATAYCAAPQGDIFLALQVKVLMVDKIAGVFSLEDARAEALFYLDTAANVQVRGKIFGLLRYAGGPVPGALDLSGLVMVKSEEKTASLALRAVYVSRYLTIDATSTLRIAAGGCSGVSAELEGTAMMRLSKDVEGVKFKIGGGGLPCPTEGMARAWLHLSGSGEIYPDVHLEDALLNITMVIIPEEDFNQDDKTSLGLPEGEVRKQLSVRGRSLLFSRRGGPSPHAAPIFVAAKDLDESMFHDYGRIRRIQGYGVKMVKETDDTACMYIVKDKNGDDYPKQKNNKVGCYEIPIPPAPIRVPAAKITPQMWENMGKRQFEMQGYVVSLVRDSHSSACMYIVKDREGKRFTVRNNRVGCYKIPIPPPPIEVRTVDIPSDMWKCDGNLFDIKGYGTRMVRGMLGRACLYIVTGLDGSPYVASNNMVGCFVIPSPPSSPPPPNPPKPSWPLPPPPNPPPPPRPPHSPTPPPLPSPPPSPPPSSPPPPPLYKRVKFIVEASGSIPMKKLPGQFPALDGFNATVSGSTKFTVGPADDAFTLESLKGRVKVYWTSEERNEDGAPVVTILGEFGAEFIGNTPPSLGGTVVVNLRKFGGLVDADMECDTMFEVSKHEDKDALKKLATVQCFFNAQIQVGELELSGDLVLNMIIYKRPQSQIHHGRFAFAGSVSADKSKFAAALHFDNTDGPLLLSASASIEVKNEWLDLTITLSGGNCNSGVPLTLTGEAAVDLGGDFRMQGSITGKMECIEDRKRYSIIIDVPLLNIGDGAFVVENARLEMTFSCVDITDWRSWDGSMSFEGKVKTLPFVSRALMGDNPDNLEMYASMKVPEMRSGQAITYKLAGAMIIDIDGLLHFESRGEIEYPCQKYNHMEGKLSIVIGDLIDMSFMTNYDFDCSDSIAVGEKMGSFTATLDEAIKIGPVEVSVSSFEVKFMKTHDGFEYDFLIEGSVYVTDSLVLDVSLITNRDAKLQLAATLTASFGGGDQIAIALGGGLTVNFPLLSSTDVSAHGRITIKNMPAGSPLEGYVFTGEFSASFGNANQISEDPIGDAIMMAGDFMIDASGTMVNEKTNAPLPALRLTDNIKIRIPQTVGFVVGRINGDLTFGYYFYYNEKYRFSISFVTGDFAMDISAYAEDMGLLEFVLDLTPIDPFEFVTLLMESKALMKIAMFQSMANAALAFKRFLVSLLKCASMTFEISITAENTDIKAAIIGCDLGGISLSAALILRMGESFSVGGMLKFKYSEGGFEKAFAKMDDLNPHTERELAEEAAARSQLAAHMAASLGEEAQLGGFFSGAFSKLRRFIKPNGGVSIAIIGWLIDIMIAPFGRAVPEFNLGFSTMSLEGVKMPEGMPDIEFMPKGLYVECIVNVLYIVQGPFKPAFDFLVKAFDLTSENNPVVAGYEKLTSPLAFLERVSFMLYFELLDGGFALAAAVTLDLSAMKIIPGMGVEKLRAEFRLQAPDFALSISGEITCKAKVDPPTGTIKSMFPKSKLINKILGEDLQKPTYLIAKGEIEVSYDPVNQFKIGAALSAYLEDPRDVMWVNPMGIMPRFAFVLPAALQFDFNIQLCIMAWGQMTAAISAAVASYGAGAPAAIAAVAYAIDQCTPKRFEIEMGAAMCASNFVQDGMTARFVRGWYNPNAELSLLGSSESIEQSSLVPAGLGVDVSAFSGSNSKNKDKRFNAELLSRYSCDSRDPYGPPMMGAMSFMYDRTSLLSPKIGFMLKLSNLSVARIILAMFVNPLEVFYQDPSKAQIPLFRELLPKFLQLFNFLSIGNVEVSMNPLPFPAKLTSGTKIPAGIFIQMEDINVMGLFKLKLAAFKLNIFTLKPEIEMSIFIQPIDLKLGPVKLQFMGVPPKRRKALQAVLDAKAYEEKKNAKKARQEAAAEEAANTDSLAGMGSKCDADNVCRTCGSYYSGETAILKCDDGQEIIDVQDAAWFKFDDSEGIEGDGSINDWQFEDSPSSCGWRMIPGMSNVDHVVNSSDVIDTINSLCVGRDGGKQTCEFGVDNETLGGGPLDTAKALNVIVRCGSPEVADFERAVAVGAETRTKDTVEGCPASGDCKTCAEASETDVLMADCGSGAIVGSIVDFVYGEDAKMPKFLGSAAPVACMDSEAKRGSSACVPGKNSQRAMRSEVKRRCLGRQKCEVSVSDLASAIIGEDDNSCPAEMRMRAKLIVHCVDVTDGVVPMVDPRSGCCTSYEARASLGHDLEPETFANFFTARAHLAESSETETFANTKPASLVNANLVAFPDGERYDGVIIHRLSITASLNDPDDRATTGYQDTWYIAVTGVKALREGLLAVIAQGTDDEIPDAKRDMCDDIGGCDLSKCSHTDTCEFRLHLDAGQSYTFSVIAATDATAPKSAGKSLSIMYRAPAHCSMEECIQEPGSDEPSTCMKVKGADLPWIPLKKGSLPAMECGDRHTLTISSALVTSVPFCKEGHAASYASDGTRAACWGAEGHARAGSLTTISEVYDVLTKNATANTCHESLSSTSISSIDEAVPGCGVSRDSVRSFNALVSMEVIFDFTESAKYAFRVHLGSAFRFTITLERGVKDGTQPNLDFDDMTPPADGNFDFERDLQAGIYRLLVIAAYGTTAINKPYIAFKPPVACANEKNSTAEPGYVYFKTGTSYTCGSRTYDDRQLEEESSGAAVLLEDFTAEVSADEGSSTGAQFDGAFFGFRMSVSIMDAFKKDENGASKLLDLGGNYFAMSGSIGFLILPRVDCEFFFNPGKTGGLSFYFGVTLRWDEILTIMDPTAYVSMGAFSIAAVASGAIEAAAAAADAVGIGDGNARENFNKAMEAVTISGTMDLKPIDFTVLHDFSFAKVETALMLGLEINPTGLNTIVSLIQGTLMASIKAIVWPIINTVQVFLDNLDGLINGLAWAEGKLKDEQNKLEAKDREITDKKAEAEAASRTHERMKVEVDRDHETGCVGLGRCWCTSELKWVYTHTTENCVGRGRWRACHSHRHHEWRKIWSPHGNCERERDDAKSRYWSNIGGVISAKAKADLRWTTYFAVVGSRAVVSAAVDVAVKAVGKARSDLEAARKAIKDASPQVAVMIQKLGIKGTVFHDDGRITLQPIKDWISLGNVKFFAIHEITIMTRFKGTETALRGTVSFTFLGKNYDIAIAFSIDPFKLIGQFFKYGWDLLKLWILGTPMPARDLRDFGLDAGTEVIVTSGDAAAAELGAAAAELGSIIAFPHRGLTGTLPHTAVCSSASFFVDLSHNEYIGTIPSCFLSGARPVLLSNNKLSGEIPRLGARLKTVRLDHNDLSGDLSLSLARGGENVGRAIHFLDVNSNPKLGGRLEDVLTAAGETLRHLDVSHTSVGARSDAAAAEAIMSSSLTSYSIAGAKFVPVSAAVSSSSSSSDSSQKTPCSCLNIQRR
jgi:hypothetical protein